MGRIEFEWVASEEFGDAGSREVHELFWKAGERVGLVWCRRRREREGGRGREEGGVERTNSVSPK